MPTGQSNDGDAADDGTRRRRHDRGGTDDQLLAVVSTQHDPGQAELRLGPLSDLP